MGNKTEMLVAVRAPEGKAGPLGVTLTTDLATDALLHWGVRREGEGDWLAAPQEIWPPASTPVEGNAAALDSPFLPCSDPDAQDIKVSLPPSLPAAMTPLFRLHGTHILCAVLGRRG